MKKPLSAMEIVNLDHLEIVTSSHKKIDKQVEKQLENAKASLRKLSKQEFACIIADAEIAVVVGSIL